MTDNTDTPDNGAAADNALKSGVQATIAEDKVDLDAGPTEDELARLTPEERAALEGDDDEADADAGDDDDNGADEVPNDLTAKQSADDPPPAVAQPVVPASAAADDPAMPYPDTDPKALAAQVTTLKAELKGLRTRFDDGEIDSAAYDVELERLTDAIATAKSEHKDAVRAEENWDGAWAKSVQTFKASNGELFTDAHAAGFDHEVRAINGNPAFDSLGFRAKLDLAKERYAVTARAIGKPLTAAPAKTDPAPATAAVKVDKPRKGVSSALGEIPQTLARLPASSSIGLEDGKFSALAALFDDPNASATDLEKAMARLTPEEREAFASADI